MARAPSGTIIEDRRGDEVRFAIRFPAYGRKEYVKLGSKADGWTRARAQQELDNILADVRRGIWKPSRPEPVAAPRQKPTFHEFASEWFERAKVEGGRRGDGLTDAGARDLHWRLALHLLPWFAQQPLDAITVEDVDRYRLAKVRAGELNATSINKTLTTLAAILESAVEYGHIPRNVAHGRRRRLPSITPARTSLDRAEHVSALLDAAGTLDADTARPQRRALLAALVFAGLRISEALSLRWRDVDLARGTIRVRASKTDAGLRTVNILPVLRDELTEYRARVDDGADALVFGTRTGARQNPSNVSKRMLTKAVTLANVKLAQDGGELIPKLTPHSLRRTFASLLFAINEVPPYIMAQMGHTTANLTLAVYARQMDRRDGEPDRLRALVEGTDWARTPDEGEDQSARAPRARSRL